MKVVGSLLSRFKNLEAPERVVKEAFETSLNELLNLSINDIKVVLDKRGVLYISAPSSIKAAIFEVKESLLINQRKLRLSGQIISTETGITKTQFLVSSFIVQIFNELI